MAGLDEAWAAVDQARRIDVIQQFRMQKPRASRMSVYRREPDLSNDPQHGVASITYGSRWNPSIQRNLYISTAVGSCWSVERALV
jgi:hypothetical protein